MLERKVIRGVESFIGRREIWKDRDNSILRKNLLTSQIYKFSFKREMSHFEFTLKTIVKNIKKVNVT